MNVWRLIAHHENETSALEQMKQSSMIAVGWSETGNLNEIKPKDSAEITSLIKSAYPDLTNSHLGGPSTSSHKF